MDTGILLRNQFTRTGVEMWVKVYSPNVAGIEVVQRTEKRARRARLYYMRYVYYLQTQFDKRTNERTAAGAVVV